MSHFSAFNATYLYSMDEDEGCRWYGVLSNVLVPSNGATGLILWVGTFFLATKLQSHPKYNPPSSHHLCWHHPLTRSTKQWHPFTLLQTLGITSLDTPNFWTCTPYWRLSWVPGWVHMWAINQAGKSALLSNESSTAECVLHAPCICAGVGEQGSHPGWDSTSPTWQLAQVCYSWVDNLEVGEGPRVWVPVPKTESTTRINPPRQVFLKEHRYKIESAGGGCTSGVKKLQKGMMVSCWMKGRGWAVRLGCDAWNEQACKLKGKLSWNWNSRYQGLCKGLCNI